MTRRKGYFEFGQGNPLQGNNAWVKFSWKELGCHTNTQGKDSPDRGVHKYKRPEAYMLKQ